MDAADIALKNGMIDQATYDRAMARTGEDRGLHSQDLQAAQERPKESHPWTTATEESPPVKTLSESIKSKMGKRGQSGEFDISILSDLADYGVKIYEHGMTLAKWVAHAVKEFGEGVRDHAVKAWSKIVDAYKSSRFASEEGSILGGGGLKKKISELDKATAQRSLRLQKSFQEAETAQKEIRRTVPDEKRRNAIAIYNEAGGDKATLQRWEAGAKGKMFKQAAKDAQTLTPKEIAVGSKVAATFDTLEKRGNRYDVLNNHRDNYVPHVWNVENKATGFGSARLQDKFKYNKARTFNTIAEGDQAGFMPKTLDISNLVPAYLHEMNKVIADRQFIQDVHQAQSTEGTPLVVPRGRVSAVENTAGDKATLINPRAQKNVEVPDPSGVHGTTPLDQSKYKVLENQPALHDWLWEGKDAEGNPIFMRDDLAVHPELEKRLTATMGRSAIKQWYDEPSSGTAVIPKAIVKFIDTAQSVMKREMFGLLAPFHQVQEGTHAVGIQ